MPRAADPLADYNARRDFSKTKEPAGKKGESRSGKLRFLVQKHDATRLHYDFRLEWEGVLLSWAVTRGPSDDPGEKRLAVRTEDHPLDYGTFEGTIPAKNYGAGTVMMWDEGTWLPENDPDKGLEEGKLAFTLMGARMKGSWTLVRMKTKGEKRENWLLIKHRDSVATDEPDRLTESFDVSVSTGRTMEQIATGAKAKSIKKSGVTTQTGRRPPYRAPQLATLVSEPPEGDDWIFETKFDGYRCLAALGKGGPRLWTRNGKDWTEQFHALQGAFDPLPCKSALIDGEVMARNISGSAFSSLQSALKGGRPLVFFAFDLLSLDGTDLTKKPLLDRKEKLAALLQHLPDDGPLRMSTHIEGGGEDLFARACKTGAEGIIAKRAESLYSGRRTKDWLKIKCTRRQEFVVGGYSPSDKKGRPFASLLVGENGPEGLRYRGRVGTGFDEAAFDTLTTAFRKRKTSPFTDVPADIAADAKWVTPALVAEVDFAEFTADGHIRHGSYLGLRDDKDAKEIRLEKPKGKPESAKTTKVAGIIISHADRVIFPKKDITKGDVARYYDAAGERLLEIAGKRPLSLLRLPEGMEGEQFFQKHAGKGMPKELHRIEISESDGEIATYLDATRASAFVAGAQMGTIEYHIWGARSDRLDRPDRLVFDLDPDEGLGWPQVRRAAFDVADRLDALGLASVPVVSGGKGVHVCVCLKRRQEWETVKLFAKTLAHIMAQAEPDRFTASMSKAKRKGRIFIDWLRNERGSTAIAPYSIRARPNATVAIPVSWDELKRLKGPDTFSLKAATGRLDADCPYLKCLNDPESLTSATIDALSDLQ